MHGCSSTPPKASTAASAALKHPPSSPSLNWCGLRVLPCQNRPQRWHGGWATTGCGPCISGVPLFVPKGQRQTGRSRRHPFQHRGPLSAACALHKSPRMEGCVIASAYLCGRGAGRWVDGAAVAADSGIANLRALVHLCPSCYPLSRRWPTGLSQSLSLTIKSAACEFPKLRAPCALIKLHA